MQGTIHRLIRGKGFGFIQVDDRQYFFHHTEVQGIGFKELVPGDVVSFNAVEDEQGRNPRAVELVVVEKKEKPPRREAQDGASLQKPPAEAVGGADEAPAAPRDHSRSPRGARAPRRGPPGTPRQPPRPRKPGFRRGRVDGGGGFSQTGAGSSRATAGFSHPTAPVFAPRALAPAPADDGEFTEDLSAARGIDPLPGAPRRGRGARRQDRGRDDGRSQRPRASGIPGERGEGVVRAMNPERGFGFIETPGGDIFFHRTSVKGDFEMLNPGTRVVFVFGEGDRGSKAEDVMAV